MATDLEARVVDLETRLTFMQATLDDLNVVIAEQQGDIDSLKEQLTQLIKFAKQNVLEKDNDKPPHY